MHARIAIHVALVALLAAAGCASPKGASPDEKRAAARQMHDEVLAQLYGAKPAARAQVKQAAGYAVFSNFGTHLFMLATGQGYGVAVDNATGKKTYMRMAELGGGLGIGIKDFSTVFIFLNRDALQRFLERGLEIRGDADLALKSGDKGAAASLGESPSSVIQNVIIYNLTRAGAAVDLTLKGSKYWKDRELN